MMISSLFTTHNWHLLASASAIAMLIELFGVLLGSNGETNEIAVLHLSALAISTKKHKVTFERMI